VKKTALVALLLLSLSSVAYAVCNTDIIDESVGAYFVGVPGSYQLTACCGTPGYTFTVHSGTFPAGMSMNSSGLISGTPTTAGYTTVCIKVTDSVGCHVTRCYEIYVF
jgi:Putative Ig domain